MRFLYDIQRLRLQTEARLSQKIAGKSVDLTPADLGYLDQLARHLHNLEEHTERHVDALISDHPICSWLRNVRGVGPRMAGVILGEVRIRRAPTISSLWKFAGLAVDQRGTAERPKKGQQNPFNALLMSELLRVLANSMIRTGGPYHAYYDDYKHRKESAGWGESKGHRHIATKRYMIKMFLQDPWLEWRRVEGLPIREPYKDEYQGKTHHEITAPTPRS